jgi:hypothetical protein
MARLYRVSEHGISPSEHGISPSEHGISPSEHGISPSEQEHSPSEQEHSPSEQEHSPSEQETPSKNLKISRSERQRLGLFRRSRVFTLRLSGFSGKPLSHFLDEGIQSTDISTGFSIVIHLQRSSIGFATHRQIGIIE